MKKNEDSIVEIHEPEKQNFRGEKFEIPMFDKWKQLALFLVGWMGFQFIALFVEIIAVSVLRDADAFQTPLVSMTINCCSYGALLLVLFCIIQLSDGLKLLTSFKNYKAYIAGILCLAAIILFNKVYSIAISFVRLPISNNVNEASIQSLTDLYKVPSIIFFGVIGPICEELTYRVGLFSLCKRKSKALAYIVTMIVFSLIHFNFTSNPIGLLNEVLNLPYYCFAALAFSFTYDYFGFAGSVTAHIINNQLSLAFILFIR